MKTTTPIRPSSVSAGEGVAPDATPAAITPISTDATKPSLYEPLPVRTTRERHELQKPQQKIRLLELLPGKYHDVIRCNLQNVDLIIKPEYEALSYTWTDSKGDSSLSQPIYIGDQYNILLVTVNCANALRRLRFSNHSRVLWVDAIYIDQNNIEERSHQVGIMQDIYATAERVLVYLGEDADDHEPAATIPWMYEHQGNTLCPRDLRDKPYFTRVWVIQEIASAQVAWILLGSKGANRRDLNPVDNNQGFFTLYYDHPWLQLVARPKLRDLTELGSFLLATRNCQATDPRDNVFAILGLFFGAGKAGLVPNYHLSFSQVASGVTAFIFGQDSRLWSRLFTRASRLSLPGTRTWTVDWSEHTRMNRDVPSRAVPAPVSPDSAARFCKDGVLVLKGLPFLSLSDCTITKEAAENSSGLIEGISHQPDASTEEREAELRTSTWARNGDKLCVIDGLYDYVLILGPLENTNRQSFVGICDYVNTEFSAGLIHLLDRKKALLLSIWNEVLDRCTEDWLEPQTWEEVKDACRLIQSYWNLEEKRPESNAWAEHMEEGIRDRLRDHWDTTGTRRTAYTDWEYSENLHLFKPDSTDQKSPLLGLGKALHEYRHRRTQPSRKDEKSTPENICTLRMEPKFSDQRTQSEVNFAGFLIPLCWYFGGEYFNDEESRRDFKEWERKHLWHPGYFNSSIAEIFWGRLRLVLQSEISCHAPGYKSATQFLRRLLGQKVSTASREYDALLGYYEAHRRRSPQSISESEGVDATTTLGWIRNSMELLPNSDLNPRWKLESLLNKDAPKTWAHNFCEIWEVLSRQPGVLSQEPREEGVINEGLDEAVDDDEGLTSEKGFEERAWRTLLELVRETEGHLMALEKPFTTKSGIKTCANKTEEMKWEDVYIV